MGTTIQNLMIFVLCFILSPCFSSQDQTGTHNSNNNNHPAEIIQVKNGPEDVVWVVQLSDLHFSVHHPERAQDFKAIVGPTLSMINPSLVLITGDLTDGKSKDLLIMKQEEEEWIVYQKVMEDVVQRSGLNKNIFHDLRGNHDNFAQLSYATRRSLLVLNCILLAIGSCGGPLILRLYFVHGGSRIWLSSWLQTGGFPIVLIPLIISYFFRRKTEGSQTKLTFMNLPVFIAATFIGVLSGTCNYLAAFGIGHLPVSTAALIFATQLAFLALFAFIIVRQKFTAYSINAVVLLTVGAAVLALHAGSDRPAGESKKMYMLGFSMILGAAALTGLIFPLIEWTYMKAKQTISYSLVMEVQMVICFVATVFCTVGMIINNDFKVIPREAREYQLGEAKYYMVLVWSGIIWQFYLLGAIGIIFCASSLLSGIMVTVLLPISQVLAVIFFHDKFQAEKGVSLALSLWGFISYFYGELKQTKKRKKNDQIQETEMSPTPNVAP